MRQEHRAGEKMFVDYCGQTIPLVDSTAGEILDAQVFVAVMGASNYTHAETTWSQSLPDWTGSHVRTFSCFGAVPYCIVYDYDAADNASDGIAGKVEVAGYLTNPLAVSKMRKTDFTDSLQ